jgi:hypothetical protein
MRSWPRRPNVVVIWHQNGGNPVGGNRTAGTFKENFKISYPKKLGQDIRTMATLSLLIGSYPVFGIPNRAIRDFTQYGCKFDEEGNATSENFCLVGKVQHSVPATAHQTRPKAIRWRRPPKAAEQGSLPIRHVSIMRRGML